MAVLLLLIRLLLFLPLWDFVIVLCFVLRYFVSILVLQSSCKERSGCFAFFVSLVSRDCCVALPHGCTGCLQFVIVVFPDHTILLKNKLVLSNRANEYD